MANDLMRNDGFFDMFPSFFNDFGESWVGGRDIKADIHETDKDYEVTVDVPGLDKKDIHLDYNNDILTVEVKRDENHEEKDKKGRVLRRERRYGSSSRQFYLKDVDRDGINAKYDNGVLNIVLPKSNSAKDDRKAIDIH